MPMDKNGARMREYLDTPEVKEYFEDFFNEYSERIINYLDGEEKHREKSRILELEKENSEIRKELDDVKNQFEQISEQNDLLQKENSRYDLRYSALDKAYQKYLDLPDEEKERLKGLIPTESLFGFICSGVKWDNVMSIWNFAKRRVIEEQDESLKYAEIFEILFQVYVDQNAERRYELIDSDVGERYDMRYHSIIGTKTDGKVYRVLLNGIIDNNTGQVIEKSIIEIE